MAGALDLGSSVERRTGSNPVSSTKINPQGEDLS